MVWWALVDFSGGSVTRGRLLLLGVDRRQAWRSWTPDLHSGLARRRRRSRDGRPVRLSGLLACSGSWETGCPALDAPLWPPRTSLGRQGPSEDVCYLRELLTQVLAQGKARSEGSRFLSSSAPG